MQYTIQHNLIKMNGLNTIPDFKMYYCEASKINYFVLGYFGNNSSCINVSQANQVAKIYAKEMNVSIEKIVIDTNRAGDYRKGYKYLFSTEKQEKHELSESVVNFYDFITM